MDLGVLRAFAEENLSSGAAPWHDHLADLGRGQVSITDLLLFLVRRSCCPGLYVQLCIWVAQGVERSFCASTPASLRRPSTPVSKGTTMLTWSKAALDRLLAGHIHKSVTLSEDLMNLRFASVATDKSSVRGLPLQNSFLQLGGTDIVFPALSQAARPPFPDPLVVRVFFGAIR